MSPTTSGPSPPEISIWKAFALPVSSRPSIVNLVFLRLRPQDGQYFIIKGGFPLALGQLRLEIGRALLVQVQHFLLQGSAAPGELVQVGLLLWPGLALHLSRQLLRFHLF